MNLEELMSVWQSQNAAPLHEANQTLLHLALRQDEAQLQKQRRLERWIVYFACLGMAVAMAIFLAIMIAARDRRVMTGWDYAIALGGAVGAVVAAGVIYANYQTQQRRERLFGDSLRDQLRRRIAQLDDDATKTRATLVMVLLGGVFPIAILILGWRINGKSLSDDGYMLVWLIAISLYAAATGVWEHRRQGRATAPRKRRLEELLQELESP